MKLHKTAHTKTTSCLASASKKFEDELKQGADYNAKMLGEHDASVRRDVINIDKEIVKRHL